MSIPTHRISGPSAYGHGLRRLWHGPHGPHAGCLSAGGRSHQQLPQSLGLDGPVAAVPDATATGREKTSRCHGCGWTIPMKNVMILLGKYGKIWENIGTYGKIWEHMGKYGKIWDHALQMEVSSWEHHL